MIIISVWERGLFKNMFKKNFTLSNFLTITRILLTPSIVSQIIKQAWNSAGILFFIAALTDVFDGICARFLNQRTVMGSYLDPLADKILILSCYCACALSGIHIPWWFIVFMIIKEFLLVIGALCAKLWGYDFTINPTMLGKIMMAVQSIFLAILFISLIMHSTSSFILTSFLWIILIGAVISCAHYYFLGIMGIWI